MDKGLDISLLKADPIQRMTASAVVFSRSLQEVWLIGDCHCIVDGKYYDNPKPYEIPIATTEYAGATYYAEPKKKYRGYSGQKSRFAGGFISGREAVDDWFDNHRTLKEYKRNTVTLVAVAAMYYGYYLEHGTHGGHRKIKVISGLVDELSRGIMPLATEAGYNPRLVQGLGYNF